MVLTVAGTDRPGLIEALARIVHDHGGNWEHGRLAELAGLFAGLVVVDVPDGRADGLRAALRELDATLHVGVHEAPAAGAPSRPANPAHDPGDGGGRPPARTLTLGLVGNDHPGIVQDLSAVFARHGVSIDHLHTDTRDAPMDGARLFEARLVAPLDAAADLDALRADLETIAAELMVDLTLDP